MDFELSEDQRALEDAVLHANHADRGVKPDRSSGPKTRQATKDQISRRS